jgi:N-acetyl sugar amidotransferase
MNMRQCVKCVMDTTDPDISFDGDGVCSHCQRYENLSRLRLTSGAMRENALKSLIAEIKSAGLGKPYDCIIGISGGVDSTYVAWLVRKFNIRPLAVHLDNGWNSELAVANIQKTLETLGIDLHTHVIDWEQFRDLQVSFLKASTPDGEVPTDHAIFALLYEMAVRHGLKHVITGTNVVTEAILPLKWGYGYFDWRYIKDVHRRFGSSKLSTYPHFSLLRLAYYVFVKKVRMVSLLNYVDYDKTAAMRILQDELGWVYYGGKHYESIYTRFYQAFVLPRKFDIDKRKAHYSNLICSNQLTRDQSAQMMREPVYPEDLLMEDRAYVIKKLHLSEQEFDSIMTSPNLTFENYRTSYSIFERAKKVVNASRGYIG